MSHPQIEEVSDSDLSDPSEGDIDDFAESDILRSIPTSSNTRPNTRQPAPPSSSQLAAHPMVNPAAHPSGPQIQPGDIKNHQMLYPIYFDATRSRAGGRRVPSSLAVKNPLAREIANACAALRLQPVFEAHKVHPKDWANPGRVRIQLKSPSPTNSSQQTVNPYAKQVTNKHHLYILVAKHLRAHPTTEDSEALRRVRVPGLGTPEDGQPWPRPAVPRGWKMGELLPAYSAAMTGGGVSENAFKDMMKEMQGGPGGPGGAGGGPTADMMSMLGGMPGMSGGSAGESAGGGQGGGGGKKGKKGKGRA
ncbi:signal recognition particle, SRP19 subunit [Whalleya microplaca]|nr:signal recognition particle, SRP19 subunit [Whalleya microplaca]